MGRQKKQVEEDSDFSRIRSRDSTIKRDSLKDERRAFGVVENGVVRTQGSETEDDAFSVHPRRQMSSTTTITKTTTIRSARVFLSFIFIFYDAAFCRDSPTPASGAGLVGSKLFYFIFSTRVRVVFRRVRSHFFTRARARTLAATDAAATASAATAAASRRRPG